MHEEINVWTLQIDNIVFGETIVSNSHLEDYLQWYRTITHLKIALTTRDKKNVVHGLETPHH